MRRPILAPMVLAFTAIISVAVPAHASTSSDPSPRAVAPAATVTLITDDPRVGKCFARPSMDHWVLTGALATTVPCTQPHQARTIGFVDVTPLRLSMSFARAEALRVELAGYASRGQQPPADKKLAYDIWANSLSSVLDVCAHEFGHRVAAPTQPNGTRRMTLFDVDLTGPNQVRWAAGDRLARCDIVRRLPIDATHPSIRMLPLPLRLAGEGTKKANQYCWRYRDGQLQVRTCTSPAFAAEAGGAWLTVYDNVPWPRIAKPTTASAARTALIDSCRSLMRLHVNPRYAPLPASRIYSWAYNTATGQKVAPLTAWGKANHRYGCAMPNWAYI